MSMNLILHFDQIGAEDLPLVGGKGANLGEMLRAGFPIPPGFCITTAGFESFISAGGAMRAYYDRLAEAAPDDLEGVRSLGNAVREYLAKVEFPPPAAEAALKAWRQLGTEQTYAIRSSATAEDLPTASFAGQQDTFLNVRGEKDLLDSIKACWISLFTDRAILYRAQNGFDHRQVQLSVVVQQMVLPEISGTLFTADPVSGHRDILTIDASYGLGEALVAGLVTPDLYKVDKRTWQVVEVQIADKRLAIRPKPGGGTIQERLTGSRRRSRVLSEAQALQLARLAAEIENHYRSPQDIEWAFSEGDFHIVQSRPVTSLYPLPPLDGVLRVFYSLSHAQVMTDAMSPMGVSVWKLLVPFGRPLDSSSYNPYFHNVGGRMYLEITPLLNTKIGRDIVPRAFTVADPLTGLALQSFLKRERFLDQAARTTEKVSLRGLMWWLGPLLPQALYRLWIANPEKALPTIEASIRRSVDSARRIIFDTEPGLPRLHTAYHFTRRAFIENAKNLMPYVMTIMMSMTLLERLVRDQGAPEDLAAVQSGLEGNVTTMMDLEVGDLADIVRQHPEVERYLRQEQAGITAEGLQELEGGPVFSAALEGFLEKYGMRGPSEIDIGRDRWRDNPQSLFRMITGSLGHEVAGAHREYHRKLVREGEEAGKRLVQAVRKGPAGWLKAALVRRMVRVFRTHMVVREHPKYMLVQMFAMIRQVMLDAAEYLTDAGRLSKQEDIWLLEIHEVLQAFEQPNLDIAPLIAARRQSQAHFRTLQPPRLFTSEGELLKGEYSRENIPEGAIPGSSVSGGVVEGPARVITDPSRAVLHPGEILVAPFTDPGWTPLFINAAGLVMEVGGLMTHGSVIAREYGIPAVVGVLDATRLFKTGQHLRVHGDGAYIEILGEV